MHSCPGKRFSGISYAGKTKKSIPGLLEMDL